MARSLKKGPFVDFKLEKEKPKVKRKRKKGEGGKKKH
jgi:hypothetical protein